jgi:hypothetical protein
VVDRKQEPIAKTLCRFLQAMGKRSAAYNFANFEKEKFQNKIKIEFEFEIKN